MRRERKASPLRGLMLFLLGALVGANAVYWTLTRGTPRATAPAPADRTEVPLPVDPSAASPPRAGGETPVLGPPAARVGGPSGSAPVPGGLLIPVQGVAAGQLLDTFNQARGEGRSHDAIDIMAPSGTPVLAVADGRVEKLFDSKQGGLTVYQFNVDRTHAYYYAHLQDYAPGLAEGQFLRRGQLVGRVGYTGNANPDAPHLHFAVFVLGPEKRWHEGTAINPYPLLAGGAR